MGFKQIIISGPNLMAIRLSLPSYTMFAPIPTIVRLILRGQFLGLAFSLASDVQHPQCNPKETASDGRGTLSLALHKLLGDVNE